ncbi:MAG: hypothetical protein QNJ12_15860 [Ilumatobacter sp.]|uniref:TlpA family protein disulfide reductase n=1 Tax=Ilumatobacter sp. TaxID=1967498 RepID=UPI00261F5BB8|nr:hypothetical protein [Ilumatobacter sp.]MDJ0770274.1 hypothetical protein [Ilumatobacter sp.]
MMQADAVAWVHRQYGQDVQFVGVTAYDDLDEVGEVAARTGLDSFPQLVGDDAFVHFEVGSHPMTLFIDADGSASRVPGSIDPQRLMDRVAGLVRT